MPTDIWGSPIFQFHEQQTSNAVGIAQGTLQSLAQLDTLVPSPGKIILIERSEGEEQVRVVETGTGDYIHTDNASKAREIGAALEERTARLYTNIQGHTEPYPAHVLKMHQGMAEKDHPYWRCIVEYDDQGIRLLPALKFAGTIDSAEDFRRLEASPYASTIVLDGFLAVSWASTGQIWWANDEVRKQVMENPSYMSGEPSK